MCSISGRRFRAFTLEDGAFPGRTKPPSLCFFNVPCYGVDLQVIQSKIYEIRRQRVMLDKDLAGLMVLKRNI